MSTATTRPRIVVGIDGSPASTDALRWAARLAPALGASIDAVSAWEVVSTYGWSGLPPYEPELVNKTLTEAADEVFGADRPADLRLLSETGSPAPVLIEASKSAAMVIVGSRGHGGFTGLLIGSVSTKVAEHAHCPVLVVHGDTSVATS